VSESLHRTLPLNTPPSLWVKEDSLCEESEFLLPHKVRRD